MGKSIRDVYGETLAELGAEYPDIVVLDADLSGSTKSKVFGQRYPERFFNMGIAESDMVACAAGLASVGKIPFANTFTVFLTTLGLISTRAQVCYGGMNVKLAGAYGGVSDALDGATHHATEDIAFMRALPNMQVIVPSDAASTRWATRYAAEHRGPVYLRLSRSEYPDLYPQGTKFEAGKGIIVREGGDAVVFAVGLMVHKALQAAEILRSEGIELRVVDLLSVKPIDRELIVRCARETGAVVCAEEHQIHGGAGSAVAEVLAWAGVGAPTEFTGVQDTFTETGDYDGLLKKYGLDAAAVAGAVRKAVARK
jgi:transketolase